MAAFSSIGEFLFIRLSGPVPNYQRDFAFQAVGGVDGHAIWDLGQRGTSFTLHSFTDTANYFAARELLERYQRLQLAGQPVDVYWSAIQETRKVLVQTVREIEGTPRTIVGGIGGTYTQSMARGLLICSWKLHNLFEEIEV